MQNFPLKYPKSEHEERIGEYFDSRRRSWRGRRAEISANGDYENFIICFTNRSGSNLLANALKSSDRFGLAGEYFNHPRVLRVSEENGIGSLADYLRLMQSRFASKNRVFGTKLGWGQLYYLTRIGIIPEVMQRPRFVVIERQDILGQAISYSIAYQTKKWSSKHKSVDTSYRYDENDILRRIFAITQAHGRFREYFAVFGIDAVTVTYEQLEEDVAGIGQRVVERLGIPGTEDARVTPEHIPLQRQRGHLNEEIRARFLESHGLLQSAPSAGREVEHTSTPTA